MDRRSFIKITGAALAALAAGPYKLGRAGELTAQKLTPEEYVANAVKRLMSADRVELLGADGRLLASLLMRNPPFVKTEDGGLEMPEPLSSSVLEGGTVTQARIMSGSELVWPLKVGIRGELCIPSCNMAVGDSFNLMQMHFNFE